MDVKLYLRSVRGDGSRYITRAERLRASAGYGCGRKGTDPLTDSSGHSRIEDNICALVDLERETYAHEVEDVVGKDEAIELIKALPRQIYREVLYFYYIEEYSWDQVSRTIKRSIRQTYRLHGWALQALGYIFIEKC